MCQFNYQTLPCCHQTRPKKNRKCRKFNPVAVKAEMQALVSESSTDKDVIRGFSCSPGG